MGIERIVSLVQEKGGITRFPNLFIAALGEKAQLKAFELANLALDELDLSSLNPKRSQVYALRFRQTCRPLWSR